MVDAARLKSFGGNPLVTYIQKSLPYPKADVVDSYLLASRESRESKAELAKVAVSSQKVFEDSRATLVNLQRAKSDLAELRSRAL